MMMLTPAAAARRFMQASPSITRCALSTTTGEDGLANAINVISSKDHAGEGYRNEIFFARETDSIARCSRFMAELNIGAVMVRAKDSNRLTGTISAAHCLDILADVLDDPDLDYDEKIQHSSVVDFMTPVEQMVWVKVGEVVLVATLVAPPRLPLGCSRLWCMVMMV